MKTNAFRFWKNSDQRFDETRESFNKEIESMTAKGDLGIQQNIKDHTTTSLFIDRHSTSASNMRISFSESVSLAPADSEWPLRLTMSLSKGNEKGEGVSFSENFNIDKSCKLRLINATKTDVTKLTFDSLDLVISSLSYSGKVEVQPGHFTLPKGSEFLGAMPNFQTTEDMDRFIDSLKKKKLLAYYDIHMPLVDLKIETAPKAKHYNLVTKKTEELNRIVTSLSFQNKNLTTTEYFFDPSSPDGFEIVRSGDLESQSVEEAFWDQAQITKIPEIVRRIINLSHEFSLQRPVKIRVNTNSKLQFPNLSAYWQQISFQTSSDNVDEWPLEYTFISQPTLTVIHSDPYKVTDGPSQSNPNLKETANIQISLPEIKEIVRGLKINPPPTRAEMVQKILDEVHKTITADLTMVQENYTTKLTTSEVLQRKKGVCQHFANLFTAIARGVGIPTRIVDGYHMSEGQSGYHAWNEVEIQKGVWLPVEPQSNNLGFDNANYFPITVTSMYDDEANKKAYLLEYQNLINLSFKLENIK